MSANILHRISRSLFHVYKRKDLQQWDVAPQKHLPIYGIYHIMLDTGWEKLARKQIENLKNSGLLAATEKLFISCIAADEAKVDALKQLIDSDKVELIAFSTNPQKYEYPALQFIKELSQHEDCLVYYFHSKGISYQSLMSDDRLFRGLPTENRGVARDVGILCVRQMARGGKRFVERFRHLQLLSLASSQLHNVFGQFLVGNIGTHSTVARLPTRRYFG